MVISSENMTNWTNQTPRYIFMYFTLRSLVMILENFCKIHCHFVLDINKKQIVPTSCGQPAYDSREDRREGKKWVLWETLLIYGMNLHLSTSGLLSCVRHFLTPFLKVTWTPVVVTCSKDFWEKVLVFSPASLYFDHGTKRRESLLNFFPSVLPGKNQVN